MEAVKQPDKFEFEFYNRFQKDFYTSVANFSKYNNYQINKHCFMLLAVMGKRYANKANDLLSIYGNVIKVNECPDLIRALQHDFTGGYVRNNMEHVYYKQAKAKAKAAKLAPILKKKNKPKNAKDFPEHIVEEIQSFLLLDSKDYETLRYSEIVQRVGLELSQKFEKSQIKLIKQKGKHEKI